MSESGEEASDFDFVSWQDFVTHLEQRQFPASFLQNSQDPPHLLSDLPVRKRISSSNPEERCSEHWVLIVCGAFEWDILPDPDNIARLVDALQYKVRIDAQDIGPSNLAPLDSSDDPERPSIRAIFEDHSRNYKQSQELLRSSPRAFLDIGLTLVREHGIRLDNVQLCDWLEIKGDFGHEFASNPEVETLLRISEELRKEDLLEIYSGLLDHLHVPVSILDAQNRCILSNVSSVRCVSPDRLSSRLDWKNTRQWS